MIPKKDLFAGMTAQELAELSQLQQKNAAASQSHYGFKATPKNGPFLTPRQLADILKVSVKTLERLRKRGGGPPFIKFGGGQIRYPVVGLDAWLKDHEHGSSPG